MARLPKIPTLDVFLKIVTALELCGWVGRAHLSSALAGHPAATCLRISVRVLVTCYCPIFLKVLQSYRCPVTLPEIHPALHEVRKTMCCAECKTSKAGIFAIGCQCTCMMYFMSS